MTDYKTLPNDQINKAVAKKLGICWHDFQPYCENGEHTTYCIKCFEEETEQNQNPDFCTNAKVLLEELEKRDDYRYFIKHVSSWVVPFKRKEKLFLNIDYVKNPRQLAEEFLRWEAK